MMKKWLLLMVTASSAAMLSGCDTQSTSPTTKGIDDQALIGTWQCKYAAPYNSIDLQVTSTNSYSKDGNANIVYKLSSVNSEDQPLMFMAAGKGTWKVTGKTLTLDIPQYTVSTNSNSLAAEEQRASLQKQFDQDEKFESEILRLNDKELVFVDTEGVSCQRVLTK
ncbi:TPA: hypothetical protein ACX6SY_000468 [Photobacterium damselae]